MIPGRHELKNILMVLQAHAEGEIAVKRRAQKKDENSEDGSAR